MTQRPNSSLCSGTACSLQDQQRHRSTTKSMLGVFFDIHKMITHLLTVPLSCWMWPLLIFFCYQKLFFVSESKFQDHGEITSAHVPLFKKNCLTQVLMLMKWWNLEHLLREVTAYNCYMNSMVQRSIWAQQKQSQSSHLVIMSLIGCFIVGSDRLLFSSIFLLLFLLLFDDFSCVYICDQFISKILAYF